MEIDPATRVALRDLVDGYARGADRRDRSGFEALFAPGATVTVHRPGKAPHTYRGSADIGEIVPRLSGYALTFHLVANHWCQLDDADLTRATGEAYGQAHHLRRAAGDDGRADHGPAVDLVLHLRYEDTYGRGPDGWRFTDRQVHILWTSEVPVLEGP